MGSWHRNFNEHALWARLSGLQAKVGETENLEDADDRDTLDYIGSAVTAALARRNTTPPLLVTGEMLQGSADAVDNLIAYFEEWREGGYTAAQVDAQTEAFITTLAAWPAISSDAAAETYVASTQRIVDSTDAMIESLETKNEELSKALAGLESKSVKLAADLETQKSLLDGTIQEFTSKGEKALAVVEEDWGAERAQQTESAEGVLERLAKHEQEARNLVQATASSAVATDYGRYARNKTIAAWICDVAAAIIGAAGVGAILLHLYRENITGDGDVGLSLTRLAASLGTLGIAALVAHRGHDHHKEARAAKRADLAVRQVGPFVANLPEDVRERVVVELTDRLFIRGQLDDAPADADKPAWWQDLLDRRRDREAVEEG